MVRNQNVQTTHVLFQPQQLSWGLKKLDGPPKTFTRFFLCGFGNSQTDYCPSLHYLTMTKHCRRIKYKTGRFENHISRNTKNCFFRI